MVDVEAQGSNRQNYGTYQPVPQYQEALKPAGRSVSYRICLWTLALVALFAPIAYLFLVQIPGLTPDHVAIPDLARVQNLDSSLRPSNVDGSKLVVVGDVHGMLGYLDDLLNEAGFRQGRDHLVALGDFISKGEQSIEVVEMLIDLGASCVRGNHEDEILHLYAEHHNLPEPGVEGKILRTRENDALGVRDPVDEMVIVRQLQPQHVRYISSCPAILDMGPVAPKGRNAVACHGGLMWNIDDLEDQDPEAVMTLRTLKGDDFDQPSEDKDGKPWVDLYNKEMKSRKKADRSVVYYGHDAHLGLNIQKYTRGHDTGCFKGRELSASVITQKKDGSYVNEVVSVSC